MALLPRKIFFELVATMVLGLIGISLVMTLVLAMVEAFGTAWTRSASSPSAPYMVPTMLPYTIPVCLLYACVVVYGGMSGSNEIIAVKAAGINVMRLVQPAIFLAVATVALGFYITDRVIPNCNLRLREVLLSDLENAVLTYLKNNNGRLSGDGSSYEIAVASVKDNRLIDPIIVRKNAQGETIANTKASEAIIHVTQSPVAGRTAAASTSNSSMRKLSSSKGRRLGCGSTTRTSRCRCRSSFGKGPRRNSTAFLISSVTNARGNSSARRTPRKPNWRGAAPSHC